MSKTKINKARKINKTKKQKKYYRGGASKDFDAKEGVVDMFKNKLSGFAAASGNYLKDKSLRLFGLQPIPEKDLKQENTQNKEIDKTLDNVGSAANNVLNDVKSVGSNLADVANKGSAAVLENFNEVLGSPQVNETISEAAHNTEQILENQLQTFNQAFDNPQFKEIAKKSLDNAAEYAEIAVDAMNKPIDKAIDKFNQAGEEATSGILSGAIKVGTDALAAVPGAGAIVEMGKIINDTSKAVGSVVEAGSEAVSTASDLFIETNENIKKGLAELEEKKKDAINIANRTNDSIHQFENPISSKNTKSILKNNQQVSSGGKTRKNYKYKYNNKYNNYKYNKVKSKRVSFA